MMKWITISKTKTTSIPVWKWKRKTSRKFIQPISSRTFCWLFPLFYIKFTNHHDLLFNLSLLQYKIPQSKNFHYLKSKIFDRIEVLKYDPCLCKSKEWSNPCTFCKKKSQHWTWLTTFQYAIFIIINISMQNWILIIFNFNLDFYTLKFTMQNDANCTKSTVVENHKKVSYLLQKLV